MNTFCYCCFLMRWVVFFSEINVFCCCGGGFFYKPTVQRQILIDVWPMHRDVNV